MDKQDYVFLARLSELAERYDEINEELNLEERNLLSIAYKNVIGSRRSAWRVLSTLEHRDSKQNHENKLRLTREFKSVIEAELKELCWDIINLLQDNLIKKSLSYDEQVFYYKMKGDYYRYLAEFTTGIERASATDNSLSAYNTANNISLTELKPINPIRLGLALNFSVFYYEIMEDSVRACTVAKEAFDEAVTQLNSLSDDCYKDSTLILHLLRDNLTLWSSDNAEQENDIKDDLNVVL